MMNETKVGKDAAAPGSMDEQIARIIEQAQVQGLQLTGEGVAAGHHQAGGRGCVARGDGRPPGI